MSIHIVIAGKVIEAVGNGEAAVVCQGRCGEIVSGPGVYHYYDTNSNIGISFICSNCNELDSNDEDNPAPVQADQPVSCGACDDPERYDDHVCKDGWPADWTD